MFRKQKVSVQNSGVPAMPDDLVLWADIGGRKKVVAQRYRSPKGKLRIDWFVSQHQRRNLLSIYLQDANPPT